MVRLPHRALFLLVAWVLSWGTFSAHEARHVLGPDTEASGKTCETCAVFGGAGAAALGTAALPKAPPPLGSVRRSFGAGVRHATAPRFDAASPRGPPA